MEPAWVRVAKLPGSRAKTAILQLAKTVDDPAIATLYVGWLAQGNWPAPTAKIVWERIFAHLVALDDGSVVGELRALAKALPHYFVGAAHRAWLADAIGATADALAKAKPREATAKKPRAGAKKQDDDLAAPVWADPDDDDLRQVVADAMTERGDPRGEFITASKVAITIAPGAVATAVDRAAYAAAIT